MTSPARALSNPVEAALALRAQGRLEDALELLSAAGRFSSDQDILRGDIQLELGRTEEAAGSYFAVIESEPENVYAYSNLALCLHRMERWEAAADASEKALELDPHRDQVRIARGDCLLRLERFEEALACFDLCWSDAAKEQTMFGKAVALQLLRRYDEAENLYQRLLALNPKNEEALCNLIAMSLEVFDLARVWRYSYQLLELSSQSRTALQGLVLVSVERREYNTAARYFARLVQHHPECLIARSKEDDDGSIKYRLSREVVERLNRPGRPALPRR
jgi:tetratricopeptide (TPR) repeat protein